MGRSTFCARPSEVLSSYLERVFLVSTTRVIPQNPLIHRVAKLLIHRDGWCIRDSNEQIHKVRVVQLLGHVLEVIHQVPRDAEATKLGCHRQHSHVTVPVLIHTFGLAHNVAHDGLVGIFLDEEIVRPLGQVLQIKRHVVLVSVSTSMLTLLKRKRSSQRNLRVDVIVALRNGCNASNQSNVGYLRIDGWLHSDVILAACRFGLLAGTNMSETKIVRRSVEYKPTYQRFVLKKKSYTQQYSHIYVSRLLVLRDAVQRRLAPDQQAPLLPKIIDLRPGSDCIIVGTVLKVLEAKPDLFQSLTNDEKIISLTTMDVHMATKTDQLILEDESGRVELIGDIDAGLYATGVVMGVRGRMIEGKNGFYVEEVFVPGLPPQPALPERGDSEYVALVSGLSIGRNNDATPLKNHLLMDYLAGRVGNQEEKQFISQIVRTIVVGNSVDSDSAVTQPRNGVIQKKKTTEELTLDAAPMRNLDELLSTLASSMSVDVMPGESDPSNHALPQQSFHSCLFPRSARFASFRAVTNPYEAQVGNVAFLGHSGQPLKSLLQCTLPTDDQMVDEGEEDKGTTEHALDCLERCLQWRHAAPTAPDLLTSFPIANDDPFVIESCPHVFFSGNAAKFGTRSIEGPNGQSVRLVLVPSFNETSTVVLVDLKDLSCFPISIDL